ncbi:patatin-like phospholipase family protein [Clostridium septicum]|uniref:Phospholipase n=1 Tax=Clostridium septicum TaxID=1504 RepID=A0A9N7JKA8_CLOSE|nr:patatin-like phospholipase family protein [Clostridium septicum]AYE33579.1 phospholipase [Clostridium septicum]QAS61743.1 patatin-like phospholipase family protein [Clostridium septicum]UEC21810.1 patatin-like phospholipase family protein [Clostridium septicum]USS00138.1 patatin-like phospholipase family protein [Clostridium septicum]WLF68685.1 patatin-like phospholipase family protein [Clostridium septicum]
MRIGLVLSGGGGKGAYELGVWKALKELEIDKYIDVFSGTSIGAFNAVLFAQDDMYAAEELWDEVTMDKLVPIGKFELFKKGFELAIGGKYLNIAKKYMLQKLEEGAVPKDGAKEIIDKYLDISRVKERKKICYAACTELPDFTAKYFKINDYDDKLAKEMVVASASLPLIYDCTEILGHKYIDGGVADNTPIQPVYGEGCDIIIVVLLSKESRIDRSLYPNTEIIELAPKKLDENVIKGTLNLDEESKRIRIREGYYDTIELLKPIMLMTELKVKIEEEKNYPILFKLYNWIKKKTKHWSKKTNYNNNKNTIDI